MGRRFVLWTLVVMIAVGVALTDSGRSAVAARAPQSNVVIDWNHTMLATLATAKVPAPPAARDAAIVQAAVFDSVNGIKRRFTPIHVAPAAPRGASTQAAAVSAAYTALVSLFPAQKATLDANRASSLNSISDAEDGDNQAIVRGLAWGKTVADQMVAWRATDGFSAVLPTYVIGTAPGDWQPTPPLFATTPVFRTLAATTPFALTSPSQFRPAGPPALPSAQYATDFNEVKAKGSATDADRTPFQTETARFWQLDTPTAAWNRVADSLAQEHHTGLLSSARLLALLNVSEADAAIAVWDAKNTFNSWRPVTAIAQAAYDGNPATSPEVGWLPLLPTPVHQEYPSGHSGVSSAATSVLASFFGERTAFTVTSDGLPGASRSFTSFSDALAQVADARVFAGFHFRSACADANQMGAKIATYVEETLMVSRNGDGSEGNQDSSN